MKLPRLRSNHILIEINCMPASPREDAGIVIAVFTTIFTVLHNYLVKYFCN